LRTSRRKEGEGIWSALPNSQSFYIYNTAGKFAPI